MRSSEEIRAEIEVQFGFFPPFFEPALSTPGVLESLWQQTLTAYVENPIPALFKEKLAASIARFCTVPYCLLSHSSALRPLGMKSSEVLEVLQTHPLDNAQLVLQTKKLGTEKLSRWPEPNSEIEDGLFNCCLAIFLEHESENCHAKLRQILPTELYDYLNLFLAYNKTCLLWAEAHPELNYQSDKRVQNHYAALIQEDPKLAHFFDNYRGRASEQTARRAHWLAQENKLLVTELRKSQEWLSATLHGIGDAVIATDTAEIPLVTFLNGVAEELTGWTLAEARGKPVDKIFNIINSSTRLRAVNPIAKVITTGKVQGLANHTVLIRRDKTEFTIEDSAAPIKNIDGSIQGVVLIFRDVTKEKTAAKAVQEANEKRAREVASERDNLLSLFEASPSPNVLWRTKDLIYEKVSPSYQSLLPGRVLIGRAFRDALPEKEYEHFFEVLQGVFETGVPVTMPEQLVWFDVDGTGMKERYYTLSFFQIKDAQGKPYGVYQQAVDNTEQVYAREVLKAERAELAFERQKLETIFQESPASMALWRGQELVFEMVNPPYQALFGDRELIAKPLLEALPELAQQTFPQILKTVFETGVPFVGREFLAKLRPSKDAPLQDRYFDFTYVRINDPNGAPYGVYDHAVDVTDRVLARQQLELAKAEAERANQTKSSFLANMSHEIRTPLGAIIGFTELLKDESTDRAERKNFIDVINRNAKALTRIIDDILDLSKVEAGRLEIELAPTSLREICQDVIQLFKDRTKSIGVAINLFLSDFLPDQVLTDPIRLRQILINIVGNAVKFTEKGSVDVRVQCDDSVSASKTFFIYVRDTGRGLTDDQRSKLFQPFSQGDNTTTREFGGTGLGLALSRRLANALGGTVEIESYAAGKGCTFCISFKANVALQAPNLNSANFQAPDATGSLKDLRILLVEDSPDNQDLIKHALARNGASITIADNGSQGVSLTLKKDFDVVLMDIQMPIMDGYTAMGKLRAKGYGKPVIALTAHAMDEERKRTLEAGFAAHVTKPIEFPVLIKTILEVINADQLRQSTPAMSLAQDLNNSLSNPSAR